MNSEELEQIKKVVEEFFEKATFEVEAEVLSPQELTIPIKIKTEEPKILIGQQGQTLAEIQRLLKAVLKRRIPEGFYLDLDINDYKKKKAEYLRETARDLADEVALNKKERILAPMPAFERRIIHLELAGRQDINTESIGQDPERRLVIKPAEA